MRGLVILKLFYIVVLCCCLALSVVCFDRPVAVHVDLKHSFYDIQPTTHSNRQFTELQINGNTVFCGDLSPSVSHPDIVDQSVHTLFDNTSSSPKKLWNDLDYIWTPESQTLHYLVTSKTAWLMEQCFIFKRATEIHWIFDICIGRTIGQFYRSIGVGDFKPLYSIIGIYDSLKDEIYANGTVVQHYLGGSEGRSARLILNCGIDTSGKVVSVEEHPKFHYSIIFQAPAFCDWRLSKKDTVEYLPGALIQGLQGWCSNFTTNGWWIYEYCYPDSLTQFHIEPKTGQISKKNTFLLGALYPFGASVLTASKIPGVTVPTPSPAFPILRSPFIHQIQSGEPIRWPALPLEVVDAPLGTRLYGSSRSFEEPLSILQTPIKALKMEMQNGTSCGTIMGMSKYRQANIYFMCPKHFIEHPYHKIVDVRETSLCQYEVYISTSLVCPHPALLHNRVPNPETIICYGAKRLQQQLNVNLPVESNKNNISTFQTKSTDNKIVINSTIAQRHYRLMSLNSPDLVPGHIFFTYSNNLHIIYKGHGFVESSKAGYYSTGTYIRRRFYNKQPNFHIGDVIRHKRLNVRGVIIGWDMLPRLPLKTKEQFYNFYSPLILHTIPFYLILPEYSFGLNDTHGTASHLMYSPEMSLIYAHDSQFTNKASLHYYFKEFSLTLGRYILWDTPEDLDDHKYLNRYFISSQQYPDELLSISDITAQTSKSQSFPDGHLSQQLNLMSFIHSGLKNLTSVLSLKTDKLNNTTVVVFNNNDPVTYDSSQDMSDSNTLLNQTSLLFNNMSASVQVVSGKQKLNITESGNLNPTPIIPPETVPNYPIKTVPNTIMFGQSSLSSSPSPQLSNIQSSPPLLAPPQDTHSTLLTTQEPFATFVSKIQTISTYTMSPNTHHTDLPPAFTAPNDLLTGFIPPVNTTARFIPDLPIHSDIDTATSFHDEL